MSRKTRKQKKQTSDTYKRRLKANRKKVESVFKPALLREVCNASTNALLTGPEFQTRKIHGDHHALLDRGASILGVAHCDTVQNQKHFAIAPLTDETLIYSPRLDDRLGVYTLLYLLPSIGINLDVLLTDKEEIGASTAQDFVPTKAYKWMAEFDRTGTTSTVYDFVGREWERALQVHLPLTYGSYSDICYLQHLGCKAVNVAVGYHDEHAKRAYMIVGDYLNQIARFAMFYHDNAGTRFGHKKQPKRSYSTFTDRYETARLSNSERLDLALSDEDGEFFCYECGHLIDAGQVVASDTWGTYCSVCGGEVERMV